MKTLHNKIKIILGVLSITVIMVSCLPETQTMGDAGQTIVKVTPVGFKALAFNAASTPQTAELFSIRRDANSETALNSTTTVELTLDQGVLDAYNTENETEFILLPVDLGTTVPEVSSGKLTVNFGTGEFAKSVLINVPNTNIFDFSKSYALAFKATSVTGTGTLTQANNSEIIIQVMVKNIYDGMYNSTGSFNHPGSAGEDWAQDDTYDRYFAYTGVDAKEGITSGAASIDTWAADVGYNIRLTILSTTIDVGGTPMPQVQVDNLDRPDYGMFTATEAPEVPGLPCNYYNTDTKTFVLYYYYGSAPNRRKAYEELAYAGPR